jgi:mono/diheme cytochrome c family protein
MKFPPLKSSSSILLKASFFLILFTLGIFTNLSQSQAQDAAAPAAATLAAPAAGGGELVTKGEAVFNGNCKQCHAFNEAVVGPALRDAHKRWGTDARIHSFIKYPAKMIAVDAYAKALYEKYKPSIMPNHDGLPEGDIDAVIAYIKAESAKPVAAAAGPAGTASPGKGDASASGAGLDGTTVNLIMGGILIVLILIVAVLGMLVSILVRMVNNKPDVTEDDKDYLFGKIHWNVLFSSPIFKGAMVFLIICFFSKVTFDQVYAIGIQQGYAPKQPIPFSHKLHAGMYEIDCNYCHTGVNKGKSATIPAANTCMNCHNAIKTESPYIKRIYAAIERNEPIQWVRIHNLPDLAYFNHAQHVKVGGIECQTCHGPVQEMEVVQQYSTLTMGWCINCHRETVVKTEGNAYYDKLVKMHSENSKDPLKVVNIGGLECSKCHY